MEIQRDFKELLALFNENQDLADIESLGEE